MAFVLKQSATYTWPVLLLIPVDGGKREKHTLDIEYKRLPQTRIDEIIRLARLIDAGKGEPEDEEAMNKVPREIIAGWSGVTDDQGEPILFSEARLTELLLIPTVGGQIVKAWFESMAAAKKPTSRGL